MVRMGKKIVIFSSIIAAFMTVAAPVSASPISQTESEITPQYCNPCKVKAGYMYPKSQYSRDYFTPLHYITVDGVEYFFWYIDDDKSTATHWYTVWKEE
ncbi:hypothetical protein SAMN04488688_112112 [Paenibacillus sp. cl141a]|uniref:hypothetical protein n=1 Tax=Paenibacillus sp. cl141a TaxID=1761877 RepID=UPI0008AE5618|nr:hypothetical protein [Paenibacillus sp. cl141a]SEM39012.1 hypothetical protein SAMN04488688_112112 [Paenibacillus sp. cl141a]